MSRVFVAGLGAVSPAGWNVAALREALDKGEPLPTQPLERPGWDEAAPGASGAGSRRASRNFWRIRACGAQVRSRTTPRRPRSRPWPDCARSVTQNIRLGLVVCLQSGCVHYSCRFFDEILEGPGDRQSAAVSRNGLCRPGQPCRGAAGKCFAGQFPGGRSGLLPARQ